MLWPWLLALSLQPVEDGGIPTIEGHPFADQLALQDWVANAVQIDVMGTCFDFYCANARATFAVTVWPDGHRTNAELVEITCTEYSISFRRSLGRLVGASSQRFARVNKPTRFQFSVRFSEPTTVAQ